ncbi:MAG: hypothetical protein ACLFWF_08185 [Alphaproteobacteria bacterium]
MRVLFLLTAVLVLGACRESASTGPQEPVSPLREGLAAYRANKIAEAEGIFRELAADPEAPEAERAGAARELARIAWLIDGEAGKALRRLEEARKFGGDRCETDRLAARILRESGAQREVIDGAGAWLRACEKYQAQDELRLQVIEARLDLAAAAEDPAVHLRAAERHLAELSEDGAGSLAGARARLETGVLTGSAGSAMQAWRDYFWLVRKTMPQALARFEGSQIFAKALKADAGVQARLALTDLLMRAGFAQTAERYSERTGLAERAAGRSEWKRIAAYFSQRKKLRAAALRVNRALARKQEVGDELEETAKAVTIALMQAANGSGDPRRVLYENYGLFGTTGETGGYPSLHIGHVVEDRQHQVSQYGHEGTVRLIVLDNMLANGFQSWLWDGWASTGGWATTGDWAGEEGGIVQVRPPYTRAPFRAWGLLHDEAARRDFIAGHAEHAAEDLAALRGRRVAHLPGVNDRLRLQAIDRIAAAVRARSGGDGEFRRAFLRESYRAIRQHSIYAHEGRHVIDKTLPGGDDRFDSRELEYRAKLSELALSDYPRLALIAINAANTGDDSNHGHANAKVLALYRKWIRDHPEAVIGYDSGAPALVQMDRLTDNQIRAVARNADPLAE